MKPIRVKIGFDDPLGGVRIAGALVGAGEADAVAMGELEENGERDGFVDGVQDILMEFFCLEGDLEHLNLRDALACWEIDGFRRELVFPNDLPDLRDEEVLHRLAGLGMSVDLAFGEHSIELGLFGVGEHGEGSGVCSQERILDAHAAIVLAVAQVFRIEGFAA